MSDIELLIKIPEEKLSIIKNKIYCGIYNPDLYKAIENGTPLPKGHGRLIDADALNRKDVNCANTPMNFIDTAHTIIEADKEINE